MKRQTHLDAVRGLAALGVVAAHSANAIGGQVQVWNSDVFSPGIFGVVLFFGISGVVIPPAYERAASDAAYWSQRIRRLYPAYLVGLLAAVLVFGALTPWALAAHLTMLPDLFGVPRINGVFWTLQIEVLFYLFVCSRPNYERWALLWLALAAVTGWVAALSLATICAGGVRRPALAALIAIGWLLIPDAVRGVRVGAALGVVVWHLLPAFDAPRVLRWLGDISYGVYLLHILIIHATPHLGPLAWVGLSVTAAAVLHETVERPLYRRAQPVNRELHAGVGAGAKADLGDGERERGGGDALPDKAVF